MIVIHVLHLSYQTAFTEKLINRQDHCLN